MENWWNEFDRVKLKCSEKNLFKATLPTTNPTQTDPESNPRVCLEFLVDKVILGKVSV